MYKLCKKYSVFQYLTMFKQDLVLKTKVLIIYVHILWDGMRKGFNYVTHTLIEMSLFVTKVLI